MWIYKGDVVGGRRESDQYAQSSNRGGGDRGPRRERGAGRPRRSGAQGTTATSTETGRAGSTAQAEAPAENKEA